MPKTYVNAGAYDCDVLSDGERQIDPPAEDDYLGASIEALMRPSAPRAGHGGGGSSGRSRSPKRSSGSERAVDDNQVGGEPQATRFCVFGVSPGVAEFYHRHSGEARALLTKKASEILETREYPSHGPPVPEKGARNFEVYGLSETHIRVLRADRGLARHLLVEYAMSKDAARIRMRARGWSPSTRAVAMG